MTTTKSRGVGKGSSHHRNDDLSSNSEQEEYDLANAEVEAILGANKPKHIAEGLTSGIGYILRGAVGACGALVVRNKNCFAVNMRRVCWTLVR